MISNESIPMKDTEALGMKLLSHPRVDVRIRAALDLGDHPQGHTELDALAYGLDDAEPAVAEAVVDALDRIVAAHPETLDELMERANDEERPPIVGLARFLVHFGTSEAIDAALPTVAGDTTEEERRELLDTLMAAKHLTNARLETILADRDRQQDPMRRLAAEILGRRGMAEGYRELFRSYGSRHLYDEFIARGPDGIRTLCCAFPRFDDTNGEIAERLAVRRKTTEAVVHELVANPHIGGIRTAVQVLGYWDEPRNVEILMQIAEDPSQDSHVREEAIVSLCRIEAPEALDLLIRTLLDPRAVDWLRWDCAAALGAIGKPDALDALERIARTDPDELLREYAKEALEVIRSPAAA